MLIQPAWNFITQINFLNNYILKHYILNNFQAKI